MPSRSVDITSSDSSAGHRTSHTLCLRGSLSSTSRAGPHEKRTTSYAREGCKSCRRSHSRATSERAARPVLAIMRSTVRKQSPATRRSGRDSLSAIAVYLCLKGSRSPSYSLAPSLHLQTSNRRATCHAAPAHAGGRPRYTRFVAIREIVEVHATARTGKCDDW